MRGKTLSLPPSTSTPSLFGSIGDGGHGAGDALVLARLSAALGMVGLTNSPLFLRMDC